MHLREIAVSSFDCRGGPLIRLCMFSRPDEPTLKHIGMELLGDRVRVKAGLNRLQSLPKLGFASRARRACHSLTPILEWEQHLCDPTRPPRRQGEVFSILPHPLPPQIDQSSEVSELPTDLV